ncbi:early nodulin-like protein 1 [Brachypodium distachyon]|uniref:Phytocyanin domain-containing protein n=1 Tax=Brachypodium distachyon TaxID=15368 RepID=I1HEE1_BRADI|nr:early nodulin-like protein 1 [Brachypodium distachyon]KQK03857.2 hypothetical protein BRADI_2g10245v3 [Brachypodium distachyon]|eukprot:XP_003565641.1 early nodulin-like protein 1 [Brachypodium distachyon]
MAAPLGSSSKPFALFAFVLAFAIAAVPAQGLVFRVGGPRGWRVPDGNTSYGWWAMNNRFHVGDALYFRYDKDSVLLVDREDFDACNATEPLAKFADGATTVPLHRPGFFCFISGEPGHCEEGQKLIVRVMVHPPADPALAPGPDAAYAPAQPGRGDRPGGGHHGSSPGTSSAPATAVAACAGVALAAAVAVGLALLLQ